MKLLDSQDIAEHMRHLVRNIKSLAGIQENPQLLRGPALAQLHTIEDAYLISRDGKIEAFGRMNDDVLNAQHFDKVTDAGGGMVFPCWCDSHTHLVFAGSRENEFVDKIKGLDYATIAAKGGGILNSARAVNAATEDELYQLASARLHDLKRLGTGAIEIKSGYGLSLEGELKMLRVIQRLKQTAAIPIKATFLGAHAVPPEFRGNKEGYVRVIIDEMLPAIAKESLADYIDVFCENGFFTPEETIRICEAGKKYGLVPKIHANQLSVSGGVEAGIATGARSVDHLESMNLDAIESLGASETIGNFLPTAAFFLRMSFPPARELIKANAAIALASDYNPGSSPSGNMNLVVAMACIQMKMLPEEALNAATINGAFAMDLQDEVGSVSVGKRCNLIITHPIPSFAYLPYSFGSNLIKQVLVNGEVII